MAPVPTAPEPESPLTPDPLTPLLESWPWNLDGVDWPPRPVAPPI